MQAPIDFILGDGQVEEADVEGYVDTCRLQTSEAYAQVREHTGRYALVQKRRYDMRVRPCSFKIGDFVWYLNPRRYVGRSPKWSRNYKGSYLVTQILGSLTVKIQKSKRAVAIVIHVDKLKPFYGEPPINWLNEMDPNDIPSEMMGPADLPLDEPCVQGGLHRVPFQISWWGHPMEIGRLRKKMVARVEKRRKGERNPKLKLFHVNWLVHVGRSTGQQDSDAILLFIQVLYHQRKVIKIASPVEVTSATKLTATCTNVRLATKSSVMMHSASIGGIPQLTVLACSRTSQRRSRRSKE